MSDGVVRPADRQQLGVTSIVDGGDDSPVECHDHRGDSRSVDVDRVDRDPMSQVSVDSGLGGECDRAAVVTSTSVRRRVRFRQ